MAKACATCGWELREGARVCTQCGTPVQAQPAAAPTAAQTMIGFTSPLAPKVEAPKPAAPAPGMNQTMLGFSAPDLRVPAPAPAATPAAAPAPAPMPVGAKTMLGIAAPGIAPLSAAAPAPAPAPPPASKAALGGTMLGVAMPGIAPAHSQPGIQAPPASTAAPQPIGARTMLLEQPPPIVPAPAPFSPEAAPSAPVVVKRRGVPLAAFAVLALVLVLGVGGAILFFSRGAPPMSATAKVSADGKEQLHLVCEGCPDGTKASWKGKTTTFAKHEADLELPAPLAIGDNAFDIALDRPGVGRDETVKIVLPLAYRIRGDLGGIGETPPVVRVDVEALPGSSVTVDGKPVTLDATGKATLSYDVSKDTTGAADETHTIERKMPYEVVGKDKKKSTGEVAIRVAVLPLHVDAPTAALATDQPTIFVAGKTAKGATVTANGKNVAVEADGSFEGSIDLTDGEQAIAIRAAPTGDAATKAAPRAATITVKRVASLADEAAALEKTAASDPAVAEGQPTSVAGSVVDARATHHRTALLVDDKKGCAKGATCLVRVDYGGDLPIRAGDTVDAVGVASKPITTPDGKTVPAVLASVVRKSKR